MRATNSQSAAVLKHVRSLCINLHLGAALFLSATAAPPAARADDGAIKPSTPSAIAHDEPRLVVLIVIDQLRGDYLERFDGEFCDDGFRRLTRHGAWFPQAFYSHGTTATGPGHACISTGANPRVHGISSNRATVGECTSDPGFPIVGLEDARRAAEGGSAAHLRCATIGETLKHSPGFGRYFSVGLKRRGAILLAGRVCDGCLWFDTPSGRFVTSRAYSPALPGFVEQFNEKKPADRYFGRAWERLLPLDDYATCAPDDDACEWDLDGMGRTFPHVLHGKKNKADASFYAALLGSPYGNELLLDLARRVIESERLGRDGVCDLMSIALSANDVVGHAYGPESQEVLDMTIQTDRQLGSFFQFLDDAVGRGRYTVALTADHGVTPVAARSLRAGRAGGLQPEEEMRTRLNEGLRSEFPAAAKLSPVRLVDLPWVFLDLPALAAAGIPATEVIHRCAALCRREPGIEWAFTEDQLAVPLPPDADEYLRMAWEAYSPDSAGEVYAGLRPYWHETSNAANHGSFQEFDRHVPVAFHGAGIRVIRSARRVDPIDVAPTLLKLLDVPPPPTMQGEPLDEALRSNP